MEGGRQSRLLGRLLGKLRGEHRYSTLDKNFSFTSNMGSTAGGSLSNDDDCEPPNVTTSTTSEPIDDSQFASNIDLRYGGQYLTPEQLPEFCDQLHHLVEVIRNIQSYSQITGEYPSELERRLEQEAREVEALAAEARNARDVVARVRAQRRAVRSLRKHLAAHMSSLRETDVVKHVFLNPDKYPERFQAWVNLIGGRLDALSDYEYFKAKRICEFHFTAEDRNRCKCLNAKGVPSLHLPRDRNVRALLMEHNYSVNLKAEASGKLSVNNRNQGTSLQSEYYNTIPNKIKARELENTVRLSDRRLFKNWEAVKDSTDPAVFEPLLDEIKNKQTALDCLFRLIEGRKSTVSNLTRAPQPLPPPPQLFDGDEDSSTSGGKRRQDLRRPSSKRRRKESTKEVRSVPLSIESSRHVPTPQVTLYIQGAPEERTPRCRVSSADTVALPPIELPSRGSVRDILFFTTI